MIYFLSGNLLESTEEFIVLNVNGVGYQVYVTSVVRDNLPAYGSEMKVYTYHHIREDHQMLFGFPSPQERHFFITMTSVSGIGPKVALKFLSTLTVDQIIQAVLQADLGVLTSVSGVGKKLAERLVIELKDKLSGFAYYNFSKNASIAPKIAGGGIIDDLMLALKTLGYSGDEIKRALAQSSHQLTDGLSLEDGIKVLLKQL